MYLSLVFLGFVIDVHRLLKSAKLLLNRCWSTYFRGGPFISEGVQLLQYYSEVNGLEGPNTSKYLDWGEPLWGGPFFS